MQKNVITIKNEKEELFLGKVSGWSMEKRD
jgi:hypothetical protein